MCELVINNNKVRVSSGEHIKIKPVRITNHERKPIMFELNASPN